MNEAQLKNFTKLNENRVLSEQGKKSPEKKKLKSEHNLKTSSKSPEGVFLATKTVGSIQQEKHPPTTSRKTPAVIVQDDLYSYDILHGNQSNNSINMININNPEPDADPEEDDLEESKQPSSQTQQTQKTANKNPMSP
jgi:hypothetical protein